MPKKLLLEDPNRPKLNPFFLETMATTFSKKYNVTVTEGEHWAMDLDNRILTYNDSLLSLSKDDVLALLLHEIGHLTNTTHADRETEIYRRYPESSHFAINTLEDFRIDWIMAHQYANSGEILDKFNDHATSMSYQVLETLQSAQKQYDEKFRSVHSDLERHIGKLKAAGTPIRQMDDTDKFMEVVNKIGYRPRMQRPVEEVMQLVTLLYNSDSTDRKQYRILQDYQNPELLDIAKRIVPIVKYTVEHLESTREVQDLWEKEVYPLVQDIMKDDERQPIHQAPRPVAGADGQMKPATMGGKESADETPAGPAEGGMHIDKDAGPGGKPSAPVPKHHMTRDAVKKSMEQGTRGEGVTKGAEERVSRGYAKKANATRTQLKWERYSSQIKSYISTAKTQLNRALKENEYTRYSGRHNSGKLNIKKLYKFPMRDFKLFQRQSEIQGKDYAFSILVDVSGSMEGHMLEETMKGVVLMAETLSKIDQPVEICFFSTRNCRPKMFNTVLDPIHIGYEATQIAGGGTDIKEPFETSVERLKKQQVKEKVMITLTDGEFDNDEKKMISAERSNNRSILHYGIGIGVNLSGIFGDGAISVKDASEIMPAFSNILRRNIRKNK